MCLLFLYNAFHWGVLDSSGTLNSMENTWYFSAWKCCIRKAAFWYISFPFSTVFYWFVNMAFKVWLNCSDLPLDCGWYKDIIGMCFYPFCASKDSVRSELNCYPISDTCGMRVSTEQFVHFFFIYLWRKCLYIIGSIVNYS